VLGPVHAEWASWDGTRVEQFALRWEGGGYVAEGTVSGLDIHYVIRLGPDFRTRQFLLFRDLDEPDLWLARDHYGRWGEMNGAARNDLDECFDIDLGCSPFTNTIPIRSLGGALPIGESVSIDVAWVDVETLGVTVSPQSYTRLAEHRWRFEASHRAYEAEFDVDEHGLVLDYPGLFRRIMG